MSNYAPALNQCEVSDDGILSSFAALGFSLASVSGTLMCCRDSTLTLELGLLPSARGKTSALRALARLRATHLSNIQQPIRGQLQRELRRGRLSVRSFFFFFPFLFSNLCRTSQKRREISITQTPIWINKYSFRASESNLFPVPFISTLFFFFCQNCRQILMTEK